jgi:sugar phosphate isomerase/epimerase
VPTHHLLFGFSIWGLEGLYADKAEGISAVADAAYHTLESGAHGITDEILARVKGTSLRWVLQCYPMTVADADVAFRRAREMDALLVNAHAGTAGMSVDASVDFAERLYDLADKAGVRLLLETHRGRMTQDLFRMAEVCERVKRLQLTLDVSHFVVAEERPGPVGDLRERLEPLLDRVGMIHGRISNGEQIQVDVGDGSGELAQSYAALWAEAMKRWRLRNPVGSAFVFTPELGPPTYAIQDAAGREFSDRWQQSLVLRELAAKTWSKA